MKKLLSFGLVFGLLAAVLVTSAHATSLSDLANMRQARYSSTGSVLGDTTVSVPTSLNATKASDTMIGLTWSSVPGASAYKIYRNGMLLTQTTATAYVDTVAVGSANTYTVSTLNSSGTFESAQSIPASIAQPMMYRTTAAVNVRSIASIAGTVVGKETAGMVGTTVSGMSTVSANGYQWVYLTFTNGVKGWVAMSNLVLYQNTTSGIVSVDVDTFLKNLPATIALYQKIAANPAPYTSDATTIASKLAYYSGYEFICVNNNYGGSAIYSWHGDHWTAMAYLTSPCSSAWNKNVSSTQTVGVDTDTFIKDLPTTIATYQSILKDPTSFRAEVAKAAATITSTTDRTKYYYHCASWGVLVFTWNGSSWSGPQVLVGPGLESLCLNQANKVTSAPTTVDVDTFINALPKTIELYKSIMNDPEKYKTELTSAITSDPSAATQRTKYYCVNNGIFYILYIVDANGHYSVVTGGIGDCQTNGNVVIVWTNKF